jgi:hypothetical protein
VTSTRCGTGAQQADVELVVRDEEDGAGAERQAELLLVRPYCSCRTNAEPET